MEKFYLEIPSLSRKKDTIEFLDEFILYKSDINGSGGLDKIYSGLSFEEALNRCLNMENDDYAKSCNRSCGRTYLLIRYDDKKIIGCINIRWNLTDAMIRLGGNIGYSIRPTQRNKGYNKINLYLGLIEAKKIGLDTVCIDCYVDNKGSNGTLKALGGTLIKNMIDEKCGKFVNRYIFDVDKILDKYKDIYMKYI